MRILAINPGSTSTKIAVYEDENPVLVSDIDHTPAELRRLGSITGQLEFRRQLVVDELRRNGQPLNFNAVIGRGGLAKPVASGVYDVNEQMVYDELHAVHMHACDLGCIIAHEIASGIKGCRCFIADPGVVDELCDEARTSGSPLMPNICIWHALNQRAIAHRYAREHGQRYEDLDLIMCHLGGGISVAAHHQGRAIDANNALDGSGPFSPERAGTLPAADLIRLCFSGKFTEDQMLAMVTGQGGLMAHLGTNDMREVLRRIKGGDKHAEKIVDAMVYHIAKSIAAEGAVLCGHVDAVILTGGIAYEDYVVSRLRRRLAYLGPIAVYPGQNEMQALALNALAVLRGEKQSKEY